MPTEAFGETLQFITDVKLHELSKRQQKFAEHASNIARDKALQSDYVSQLKTLVEGIKAWPGAWSDDFSLPNMNRFLEHAYRDPGFPKPVLKEWIRRAEEEIAHEGTRYKFAQIFGQLLMDWLKSKHADMESGGGDFENIGRKETVEQKEKLESLIFESKDIDVVAFEEYLRSLFSSKEAEEALEITRKRIKKFGENLCKTNISTEQLQTVIKSVLLTDVLSEEKAATLKEFLRNPTIIEELASVLNMQISTLKTWSWPQEGVVLEPRRHLNGRTRFHLDSEILTCLLLHHVGLVWSVEFKQCFEILRASRAWKQGPQVLDREMNRRRDAFFRREPRVQAITEIRRSYQKDHFFVCQLPSKFEVTNDQYNSSKSDSESDLGPRFDTPVDLKQSLLHILASDIVMNKELYGHCSVVRTDLEWFGPSLPFDTIRTVFKFFGVSEDFISFLTTFLSCPIVFKDDPSGIARVRKRGVPISYLLSTLCGEVVLFVMDFAVNQRADGLFLYRIHDDYWFWDPTPSRCEAAWSEMLHFASLSGLTFNKEKTGSVTIGSSTPSSGLPEGDLRWGFLRMGSDTDGRFVVDTAMIDEHIVELRRQLAATNSIFGWVQAYNKYMSFVVRNCGTPSFVYGKEHIDQIIDSLARIQRGLFGPNIILVISRMIEDKLKIRTENIPNGWFFWPNAAGGLELKDPFIELLLVTEGFKEKSVGEILRRAKMRDSQEYDIAKKRWETAERDQASVTDTEFFSFEEFNSGREERAEWWGQAYKELLSRPENFELVCTPKLEAALTVLGDGIGAFLSGQTKNGWQSLSPYWRWIIGLYHDEMVKKFGSLAIVEAGAVPIGMVSVFKTSRTKWEQ